MINPVITPKEVLLLINNGSKGKNATAKPRIIEIATNMKAEVKDSLISTY